MTRKALGRGLSALLGEETTDNTEQEFLEIDIEFIEPNPEQPRSRFTEESLEELAQSIRVNGIIQPIVVRQRGGKYQIVAGERRWRAAQKAELSKIPSIIREVSNDKLLEIALIENIQRHELNPIEEAKAYKNLIENLGLTQEMIAERVGKNRTVITTHLRLLKLPIEIQKLVEEEKITAGHARALLMTDSLEIQIETANKIIEMSLSVRETEKVVKRIGKSTNEVLVKKELENESDPNVRTAELKLRRYLSTNVKINYEEKEKSGKIEIEYYNLDDFDRIYKLLLKR